MTALEALHDVVRYFNDHAFARPTGQPALNVTPQQVEGLFTDLRLESRYQPLISVRDGASVAHEALLRAFGPFMPVHRGFVLGFPVAAYTCCAARSFARMCAVPEIQQQCLPF